MRGEEEFLLGLALVMLTVMFSPGQPRVETIPLDEEPDDLPCELVE